METISVGLSALILLSAIALAGSKRIRAYILFLRLQAILIVLNTFAVGLHEALAGRGYGVLVVSALVAALKVWFIPRRLHRIYAAVEYKVEKDFLLNIPVLVLACCAIVLFTYAGVSSLGPAGTGARGILLVDSVSLVLIGLFFMLSRRKAIGQIVGLLVIENGMFITAMYASNGMPFLVDLGLLVDLFTAVVVMGVMVKRIGDVFGTIDTDALNGLKG